MRNEWEAHRLHSKLEKQEEDQSVEESYQASRGEAESFSVELYLMLYLIKDRSNSYEQSSINQSDYPTRGMKGGEC